MKQREPLGVGIIFMILLTTKVCVFRHERCVFYSRLQKKKNEESSWREALLRCPFLGPFITQQRWSDFPTSSAIAINVMSIIS